MRTASGASLLLAAALAACAHGIVLDVGPGSTRCLGEVLGRHDLVKGGYSVELDERESSELADMNRQYSEALKSIAAGSGSGSGEGRPVPPPPVLKTAVEIRVTGPDGNMEFAQADGPGGKFAFAATDAGSHRVCFINRGGRTRRVDLEWRAGADANDYEELAKKEHLKPLELELRKLEDRVESLYKDMLYARQREEQHRNTNESTNSRVAFFSGTTIVLVLLQGALQVWYLYSFLQKKGLLKGK